MATNTQTPPAAVPLVPADTNKAMIVINKVLETKRAEIMRAVPHHVSADKLLRVALTTIAGDGKLMQCDPISIYTSVLQAAQVGLVPDGFLGQCYLVPFWNSKQNRLEAKLMIGYRGFIELATRSGKVTNVRANVVFEHDEFEYEEGLVAKLIHKPVMDPKKRGNMIAAYSVAHLKDVPREESPFRVMFFEEIEAIRKRSQSGSDAKGDAAGPWKTDWNEMAKKTTVRALAKYLNLSPEMVKAAVIDEYNEAGVTLDSATMEYVEDNKATPPAVPNMTSAANNDLKDKINQAKTNGEKKPEVPVAAETAQPTADSEPDPKFLTTDSGEVVRGTVTKVFRPKAAGKGKMMKVMMGSVTLSCFHESFHEHLEKSGGKICIFLLKKSGEDAKYLNIEAIQKIGTVEFDNGVPVMSSDEAAEYSKKTAPASGNAPDKDEGWQK